jgi:hypothetical protein
MYATIRPEQTPYCRCMVQRPRAEPRLARTKACDKVPPMEGGRMAGVGADEAMGRNRLGEKH